MYPRGASLPNGKLASKMIGCWSRGQDLNLRPIGFCCCLEGWVGPPLLGELYSRPLFQAELPRDKLALSNRQY